MSGVRLVPHWGTEHRVSLPLATAAHDDLCSELKYLDNLLIKGKLIKLIISEITTIKE